MAEYTNVAAQTVDTNQNVLFTDPAIFCEGGIVHRTGSGQFSLKGGRKYLVMFNADITNATAADVVSLALAINGEPIAATTMAYTPATAGVSNSVSAFTEIKVPACTNYTLSVINNNANAVTVSFANLIIKKECAA